MNHVQIDIETLDTEPTAVVLSVAVLRFNPTTGETAEVMHEHLDAEQQILMERTTSKSTYDWWMQQSSEARRRVFAPQVTLALPDVERALDGVVQDVEHIWANDPDFDCTILRNLFPNIRWPFWKHRSMRTMHALFPSVKDKVKLRHSNLTQHDAMNDCYLQAKMVTAYYSLLETN